MSVYYDKNGITLHNGDCLDVLATMPPESVDSIVTDPPYGLSFMGKKWDYDVPAVAIWEQCLRVLKPGGHLLAFAGTRTQHRMAVRIEDAGFEIRDMIAWVYGSGFPKSLDVSKAIDRQRHDTEQVYQVTAWIRSARDAAGKTNRDIDDAFGFARMSGHWTSSKSQPAVPTLDQIPKLLDVLSLTLDEVPDDIRELIWTLNGNKGQPGKAWFEREVVGQKEMIDTTKARAGFSGPAHSPDYDGSKRIVPITAPATDAAKQWQGWGTALKPSLEPITVARKPLRGTVAENVLTYGTGGLNVDGCRVGIEDTRAPAYKMTSKGKEGGGFGNGMDYSRIDSIAGSACGRWPANLIYDGSDEVVGLFPETAPAKQVEGVKRNGRSGGIMGVDGAIRDGRPEGHDDSGGSAARFFYCAKADASERRDSKHPTVKPVALMRYLVRLVTPIGATVLDPFCGSGATLEAAMLESCKAIGIELNPEYCADAVERLRQGVLF